MTKNKFSWSMMVLAALFAAGTARYAMAVVGVPCYSQFCSGFGTIEGCYGCCITKCDTAEQTKCQDCCDSKGRGC